jgi:hypothetical protein
MLDDTGDLIEATESVGAAVYNTIGIALGSIEAAQNMSLRTSTKINDCWFNRAAGIDYNTLFYDTNLSDAVMNPLRAQAFRETLEGTPGFGRYAAGNEVFFSRAGRKLGVELPCVIIACDSSQITPAVIG